MDNKKFYTHEEAKSLLLGAVGTVERDEFDTEVELFRIGDAIKQMRINQNLTQEELGRLVGVQKAQISKIENGKNPTLATIIRVLKAMNLSASFEVSGQTFSLC